MKFPAYERVIYQHNPLAEVICQLRFPRILSIDTDLPVDFQKEIRATYPHFQHKKIGLAVKVGDFEEQQVSSEPRSNFEFSDATKSWKVVLASEALSISTTRYERWEVFRERLIRVLSAFRGCYGEGAFTRIGLRYRDVIERSSLGLSGAGWNELLRAEVLGLLASDCITEEDVPALDVTYQLKMQPDEWLLFKTYFARHKKDEKIGLMIDCDFFTEESESDDARVGAVLDRFHEAAGAAFSWSILPRLRAALGPVAP